MIARLRRLLLVLPLLSLLFVSLAPAAPVAAACGDERFFTLPAWYRGLSIPADGGGCRVAITELDDFWQIVLNILDIGLQIAAYVALGYIIWGGFKYIKSDGSSSSVTEAKTAILQAVIGLSIALISVGIVNFVAGIL